ncbi:MAG: AraC family transcriptional regulator [Phycisphaerales bacterium]|nr:MAG: AraC family transcriptional regulator [Phycisphaerales bacterium]
MSTSRTRACYRSESVFVGDYRCDGCDSAPGAEETSRGLDVVFPRSGVFLLHFGSRTHVADANTVLFFNRHEPYRVTHPAPGGDTCTVLSLHPACVADLVSEFDPAVAERPERPFSFATGPAETESFVAQRRLLSVLRPGGGMDALAIEEAVFELVGRVVAGGFLARGRRSERSRPDTRKAHRRLARNARAVLHARLRERVTLDGVARELHTSPYHFHRVFRREVGMPVHRYLTRLRLRAAVDELAESSVDLTALALSLGFSSHSHFTGAFRREFGVSPSAFRRMVRSERAQMSKKLEVSQVVAS